MRLNEFNREGNAGREGDPWGAKMLRGQANEVSAKSHLKISDQWDA